MESHRKTSLNRKKIRNGAKPFSVENLITFQFHIVPTTKQVPHSRLRGSPCRNATKLTLWHLQFVKSLLGRSRGG